ncbi:tetrahydrofolate synthase, partial [Sarracenia purpurea var. burkii]
MSSDITDKLETNVLIKERLNDVRHVPLSYEYETAMEALSSLITRQKRGDRSVIGGKYGKLDRMLMYIK